MRRLLPPCPQMMRLYQCNRCWQFPGLDKLDVRLIEGKTAHVILYNLEPRIFADCETSWPTKSAALSGCSSLSSRSLLPAPTAHALFFFCVPRAWHSKCIGEEGSHQQRHRRSGFFLKGFSPILSTIHGSSREPIIARIFSREGLQNNLHDIRSCHRKYRHIGKIMNSASIEHTGTTNTTTGQYRKRNRYS